VVLGGSACGTFYNLVVETVWFSGYETREEGSTAVQELAFTFSSALEYVSHATGDAPRIGFTFSAHENFFEEIAKFRAARRLWPSAEFKARLSGCPMTSQQVDSNIIRNTLKAMAAVLGGAESVEGESAEGILRVIAYESGISDVPDAFRGSCFLEQLTADLESAVREYMRRIDERGRPNMEGEIAAARDEFRRRVEAGEAVVVGVNRFAEQRVHQQ
jgi:methylmalonyl-CoA mutase N-terminal domain/subunit